MLAVLPLKKDGVYQTNVSKVLALMWRDTSPSVKMEYERRALAAKIEHQELYPDYRYKPRSKKDVGEAS
jgi:hypothetical protein